MEDSKEIEKYTKEADDLESEAHEDKEKDLSKDTDDRQKDIDDDTDKADRAEWEAHKAKVEELSNAYNDLKTRLEDLEQKIIDKKDDKDSKKESFESAIGYE